jgi:hypothetical protein
VCNLRALLFYVDIERNKKYLLSIATAKPGRGKKNVKREVNAKLKSLQE